MIKIKFIKNCIVFIFLAFNIFHTQGQTDFEYNIDLIARNFQNNILNEYTIPSIESDLITIKDNIEAELLNHNEYSKYSLNELYHFKKQAEALSDFVETVNPFTGYLFMKFGDLSIVEEFINFDIDFLSVDKYCVDLIKISIGDYISYYSYNKTDINYTVYFKSNYSNMQGGGVEVTQGLPKKSIRKLSDNHENIGIDKKFTFKMSCKKI